MAQNFIGPSFLQGLAGQFSKIVPGMMMRGQSEQNNNMLNMIMKMAMFNKQKEWESQKLALMFRQQAGMLGAKDADALRRMKNSELAKIDSTVEDPNKSPAGGWGKAKHLAKFNIAAIYDPRFADYKSKIAQEYQSKLKQAESVTQAATEYSKQHTVNMWNSLKQSGKKNIFGSPQLDLGGLISGVSKVRAMNEQFKKQHNNMLKQIPQDVLDEKTGSPKKLEDYEYDKTQGLNFYE